jgi:hypothetical protein
MSTIEYFKKRKKKKGQKKIKNQKGKKNLKKKRKDLVFAIKACKSFLVEFHTP